MRKAIVVSSISTRPQSGPRSGATIDLRSFIARSQAVTPYPSAASRSPWAGPEVVHGGTAIFYGMVSI